MKKSQKGSVNIVLIIIIILLIIAVGYFILAKKSPTLISEPISNTETTIPTPQTTSLTTQDKNFAVTFPKAGDILVEGQTYNITWTTPADIVSNNGISYSIGFNWGCMPDGGGCGFVRIFDIPDISSQKSYAWTVPNLQTYLGGGDSGPNISPEDKYKITLYAVGPGNNLKTYPGSEFKIISK